MKATFLSRYTPRLMPAEVLEAVFVQRQELAQKLVEQVQESVLTSQKHYTLLTGPRGIGKTHLISLLYYRIRNLEELQNNLLIAWLSEEEWSVTSFLDLLLCIFKALQDESNSRNTAQPCPSKSSVKSLYELPADEAEKAGKALLQEFIGNQTLLLLVENLDELFAGLGSEGQKKFYAFLQETPCTIIATATSLFKDITQRKSPFFGFFQHEPLKDLSIEQARQLLANIAKLNGNPELESFIQTQTGIDRIKAVHHLAGGNHRLYVIFSEFLTSRESLDQLVDAFMRTLDDLTPYYQERMRFVSPQQRKIIDFLCDCRNAVPVKDIAQRCFMTHQTASSQLKKLLDLGYVNSEPVGRESYYELREPMMRFCLEVKKQQGQPKQLIVEFLKIWYSSIELIRHLNSLPVDATLEREYIRDALRLAEDETVAISEQVNDLLKQGLNLLQLENYEEALLSFDKAIELDSNDESAWGNRGIALIQLENYEEALLSFDKIIELDPDDDWAWFYRGLTLNELKKYEEMLAAFDKVIEFSPNDESAWGNRGLALLKLEQYEEALIAFEKVIELDPDYSFAWFDRGLVLANLEKYQEALLSFQKAIELNPNDKLAFLHYISMLNELGRDEEVSENLKKLIELDPNDSREWGSRGLLLNILKQYEEALFSFEQAIALGEQSRIVFLGQAKTMLALNRWDEGLQALDNTFECFPQTHEFEFNDYEEGIIHNFFQSTNDPEIWKSRIKSLAGIYEKHQFIEALAQGVVKSIPGLMSDMISDKAARTWLEIWQEITGTYLEFTIPLRLVDAAVQYREKKGDRRVFLELPIEERKLLQQVLKLEEDQLEEAIS